MDTDKNRVSIIGLVSGPISFFLVLLVFKSGTLNPQALAVLASAIWMAIWWITEAVPISVTALLPLVLFPVTGGLDMVATSAAYGHRYIFLFLGGFIISIAIEKWNLHMRIALGIIEGIGANPKRIILGFMMATGFLSMWISNTATSVMMLPIAMAIINQLRQDDNNNFGKALLLSIAYSASIGGMATLIGTPPNLVLAGVIEETFSLEISFVKWMSLGLPLSIILLFVSWKYLTSFAFRLQKSSSAEQLMEIKMMKKDLGPMKFEEKSVVLVFVCMAVMWMFRPLLQAIVPGLDDSVIAVMAAVAVFILPAKDRKQHLLKWDEAVKLPWGIIILFGGGMALAQGFKMSGLADWIGAGISSFEGLSVFFLVLIIVAAVNFLTEITSNLATTAMILPVLATLAINLNVHPYIFMISAALAASCAFLLPVATPPNAVVFGSGMLRVPDMARTGIWMNLISIFIITFISYFIIPLIWDFVF